jgi:hypothetical protein
MLKKKKHQVFLHYILVLMYEIDLLWRDTGGAYRSVSVLKYTRVNIGSQGSTSEGHPTQTPSLNP